MVNHNVALICAADAVGMNRMPFLYVEAPARRTSKLKIALQFLLTVAVLTFSAIVALSR